MVDALHNNIAPRWGGHVICEIYVKIRPAKHPSQ